MPLEIKRLRSFIHEKIPLELRFDLDILSRRRDLRGEEKQEEIIKLFRKYDIGNISQLGPGTNRYGLKLDGFVIKVATDRDGKVDNWKEFKMAKVLFPRVPRTHEVSENGSLLIAEYVQPFESYSEMLKYADQIREILREISSVCLIGDVGITSKNYANWGLRVGTNEVVCLDFAYVYDVTSDLFICRHCHANVMLMPNKDYTKLVCPNPACQKETLFEDIRAMISNEYHMEQIGDLSNEGYLMSSSDVPTELDDNKSNYLKRKKRNNKIKKEDINKNIEENKEDIDMFKNEVTLNAVTTDLPPHRFQGMVINAVNITDDNKVVATVDVDLKPEQILEPEVPQNTVETLVIDEEEFDDDSTVVFSAKIDDQSKLSKIQKSEKEIDDDNEPIEQVVFRRKFCDESNRAISILANKMAETLHSKAAYDELRNTIKNKKMLPEQYYREVSAAIFKSLGSFLMFDELEIDNPKTSGTHKELRANYELVNSNEYPDKQYQVLRMIERIYNTKMINVKEDFEDVVDIYNSIYGTPSIGCSEDYGPLDFSDTWAQMCMERLASKIGMDSSGRKIFKDQLINLWNDDEFDYNEDDNTVNESDDEILEPEVPQNTVETLVIDEEEDEEEFDYDEDTSNLSVEINYQDNNEIIVRLISEDAFGPINIPIYANIEKIDISKPSINMVDIRNDYWDWLAHMVPDIMFRTSNPDKYLHFNKDPFGEWQCHIVIIGKEDKDYIMGVFMVSEIYIDNSPVIDDENISTIDIYKTIKQLNKLVLDTIGNTCISHRLRSLSCKDLIHDESYINEVMVVENNDEEDEFDYNEDDNTVNESDDEILEPEVPQNTVETLVIDEEEDEVNELENAAIAALLEENKNPTVIEEEIQTTAEFIKSDTVVEVKNDNEHQVITDTNSTNEEEGVIIPQRRKRR